MTEIMTPDHDRWDEFAERLEGPEGCDFKQKEPGNANSTTWKCAGARDKSLAEAILRDMDFGDTEVAESLTYFEEHGGYCDCEILFNVAPS